MAEATQENTARKLELTNDDFKLRRNGQIHAALVVDDDAFVCRMLANQLASLGVTRVVTAADGEQACRALSTQGPFDVMTCDLQMPGTDGIELLREVNRIQPDLALILISGVDRKVLNSVEDLARARKLRLLGTIEKPVGLSALRTLLDQLNAPMRLRMVTQAKDEITVSELRAAIQNEEIDIYVQPQISASTGALVGAEALARWHSPRRGLIAPAGFIDFAERNGLIDELTDLICRKALAACANWHEQGLTIRISINISYSSLGHLDLPERITALCMLHGLAPQQVVIELTETCIMQNLVSSLDVLTRLRLRGIALAIDDFGTGHSSLTQLKRIPFNELKIDQTFVNVATRDAECRHIIESSIRLASDLGLRSVAEGVETAADTRLLRELGCDLLQGYFIAKPMPKGELVNWERAR